MKPHSVAVHPSPKLASVVAWRSPVAGALRISGSVQHAHPECGNGVTWALELRRGHTREVLASGVSKARQLIDMGRFENIRVQPGDVIAVVIGPRDGNHSAISRRWISCCTTAATEWSLAKDVSPDILAGNPHADSLGNAGVWHFYSEPAAAEAAPVIPARFAAREVAKTTDAAETATSRRAGAAAAGARTRHGGCRIAGSRALPPACCRSMARCSLRRCARRIRKPMMSSPSPYGVDPALFGKHPNGGDGRCARAFACRRRR